ncbi:hypothetical protein AYI69_g7459 [Smittium culicis]|uniref:Uncharacterized protein n=1 Tax=Smittium culicis TaxID=133412 RepID=A0A1R1XRV6_9FUNG|nr:hypothetical protein AYI69_g7459 [Smittium culicis]
MPAPDPDPSPPITHYFSYRRCTHNILYAFSSHNSLVPKLIPGPERLPHRYVPVVKSDIFVMYTINHSSSYIVPNITVIVAIASICTEPPYC